MTSCYQADAACPGGECSPVPQPGSVSVMNVELWTDTCSCSPPQQQQRASNATSTCSSQLIAFRFAPENAAQAQVCLQDDHDSLAAASFLVALYFAFPLALCAYYLLILPRSRGRESKPTTSTPPPPRLERPTATLRFKDLSFVVAVKPPAKKDDAQPTEKRILHQLTASLPAQSLTAIMGPSGCGKSTLLDILASRPMKGSGGTITGQITLNGEPVLDLAYWRRISAYVTQFDCLFPFLTVREMLLFSAQLRSTAQLGDLPGQVDGLLRDLELTACQHTRIGDRFKKGISGGQARRVTVALELLANPLVLFLDEPTSGLDSTSAKSLVETLRRLTQLPQLKMTVACTIHQPRSSTFQLFDRLILIKSGELAFAGELAAIPGYLQDNLGITVDAKANLADFIVDLTYPREEEEEEEEGDTPPVVDRLVGAWASSTKEVESTSFAHSQSQLVAYVKSQSAGGQKYVQPLGRQFQVLLQRSYLNAARNRGYHTALVLQNAQYLFYGLLFVGLRIYGEDDNSAQVNLYNKNFLYQVMNTVCIVESVVISSAFLEKQLFYREYSAGSYSLLAYHAVWYARLTVDSIVKGLLAAVLCYFFPPLRMEADAFFFFAVVLMVVSSLGGALGFLMACLINDAEGASNIHNTIIGFMGTYAGFFLPSLLIPIFTLWAYYLSFFKYSFEALTLNQFGPCASSYMRSQFLSVDETMNRWTNLLVLMAYPIIFHLLAVLVTAIKTGACKRRK